MFDGALNSKQASTESLGETAGTIINLRTVYGKQNDLQPPQSARGGGGVFLHFGTKASKKGELLENHFCKLFLRTLCGENKPLTEL